MIVMRLKIYRSDDVWRLYDLVKIFNDHFGRYFTLYTTDKQLLRALESDDDIPEEEL